MATATFVRDITNTGTWAGLAQLYRIDAQVRTWDGGFTDFVVASGIADEYGIETAVFPVTEDGAPVGYSLSTVENTIDHTAALEAAGFTVTA
jgi:hypothetical protein